MYLFPILGGLDDALNMIISLCSEQDVPFVFALGRRSLGRACAKLVPVSVVGVFNYQGAEVGQSWLVIKYLSNAKTHQSQLNWDFYSISDD